MGFITDEGLEQLKKYKYKSGGCTWFDSKMDYFWQATVALVPRWVAPNLITFIGWIFVLSSYINILRYGYRTEGQLPSSCFFWAAICYFIYSTLDAIDGKQARRTKSSSPLGQLFDHGCDSFSISFFVLSACHALQIPPYEGIIIFVASQTSFWTSNWMEYHTGILITKVGQFGVTEGQFTVIGIHILTGIAGQGIWASSLSSFIPQVLAQKLPYYSLYGTISFKHIVVYGYSGLIFLLCSISYLKTLYYCQDRRKVASEYITFYIIVLVELSWMLLSFFQTHSGIIFVYFGLIQSLVICKMIISSVTKMKFQYFHQELVPLLIGTAVIFILELFNKTGLYVFWLIFVVNLVIILTFLLLTVQQITSFLKIKCFSIPHQQTK